MFDASVRVIGKEIVDAKLLRAAPNILEHNKVMVSAMMGELKPAVAAQTPLGPGHFGYHLRNMLTTDVKMSSNKSIGLLKGPSQGVWREYGTKRGERARMTAHKAARLLRKTIKQYYGTGKVSWWRR